MLPLYLLKFNLIHICNKIIKIFHLFHFYHWSPRMGPIFSINVNDKLFSLCICHRIPERTIWFFGLERFFCARCCGIHAGCLFGFLVLMYGYHIPLIFLGGLALPLVIDGFTQGFGIRESNNYLRLFTGLLFGFGAIATI